ncbi:MAG: ribosome small subunit-dependent GTPase A [Firmicutes bacterium]|nr:ribosome small subunit-dependent GTPase A [Bacillota bacterium]MCL1953477.1 ribosome small subunit-dependent GTPase A [Bacillota bacterium]
MSNKYRVIQSSSNRYIVQVDGLPISMVARKKLKDCNIVVGDFVEYSIEAEQAVIEKVEKRYNLLNRPRVSNVDGIVAVVAQFPKPDLYTIDKLSYNCIFQNINFILCINKIDLATDSFLQNLNNTYNRVAHTIVHTCALTGRVDSLYYAIENKLHALAGQSAVGKSSIINCLSPNYHQSIGELSNKGKRGKHTTTTARLFALDKNSYIIDTPGFSMLDVNEDIKACNLNHYLPDFDQDRQYCKFSSCTHTHEQQCGIKLAVENRKISATRYNNYVLVYSELVQREFRS